MCEYCEGIKWLHKDEFGSYGGHYAEIENHKGVHTISISVCSDITATEETFEFDIKYCSMCGRWLGDD